VVESAGAQAGYLLLVMETGLSLAAECRVEQSNAGSDTQGKATRSLSELPVSILNYVRRTREKVSLANASEPNAFSADPYLLGHQPKSILCLPILRQTRLIGLLYLENNLVTHAFTP